MTRWILWAAAFAAGFAITGIEIGLGRLLAPFFGSGLAVWASIIASVIGALAVGYPIGGVLADRRPGASLPLAALALGGVVGATLGVCAPVVLRASMIGVGMSGPPFWGRLAVTLGAFAIPCIALATVSPAVLRATLREKETAGRDAGVVYAAGSIGSVLGVLLPALWWIPDLGMRTTFVIIGAIAVAPAVAGVFAGGPRGPLLGLIVLPMLPWVPDGAAGVDGGATLLFDGESPIQHVRVIARDTPLHKRRWLHLAEGWAIHSSYLEPALFTGDVWDWLALASLRARPDDGQLDVLILGLAAGTASNLITGPLEPFLEDPQVTGVEIDPLVVEVADAYLGLDRSRLRVHVGDGRVFLHSSPEAYDLIILDAYAQPTIPAHLATQEFFEEVSDHLTVGGLAVLNVFAPAERSPLLDGLVATWMTVFPVSETTTGREADGFRSRLLLGGPALSEDWRDVGLEGDTARRYAWLRANTKPTTRYARLPAWTDDRAPVERLTDTAFRALRQ